ncbi:hypothetical protein DPMN_069962 [Dreissena polymorpha]|uniref:LRRCT domain-containing protein n=1 Tax=Dreissena polymorpha TaxID=45954 RepID=A0A9D4BX41_DREPO|nr:hypothetical protein DPMN_069962 [Dreissena polymorpha]
MHKTPHYRVLLIFTFFFSDTLYIVSNQITQVHPDALNNSFIKVLDLQQNLLQRIPESLLCHINQSQTLLLANNPWRCECGIQWMKSLVNNSGQEPTCAEPISYFGTKLLDAIQNKELECNPQDGTLPVPTIYPQVPPRHNYLTPKLDKEPALSTKPTETVSMTSITTTTTKETLNTTNVSNTKWIIAGAVAALLVIGGSVVVPVLVVKLLKPKIVPEPEMLIERGEISFKPCLKYTPQENGWTAIM